MAISAHEMIQVIAVGLSINSIHVSECIKWLLDCSPAHRRSLASASQSRLTCWSELPDRSASWSSWLVMRGGLLKENTN